MSGVDALGPASLAISNAIGSFQFFLPKLSEVRRADVMHNPDIVGDVRFGEVAAATLCIGVGTIVSSLSGTPYPAVVSLIMVVILMCVYENALRRDRPMNPPTSRDPDLELK